MIGHPYLKYSTAPVLLEALQNSQFAGMGLVSCHREFNAFYLRPGAGGRIVGLEAPGLAALLELLRKQVLTPVLLVASVGTGAQHGRPP